MTSIAVRDDRSFLKRPISRAGTQQGTRKGTSPRTNSVQRRMPRQQRFGQQERGSQTDRVADVRRRSPVTDPNELDRMITPENTLRRQRLGFDVGSVSANTSGLKNLSRKIQDMAGEGGPSQRTAFLDQLKDTVRSDLEGGLNREELIRDQFNAVLPSLQRQHRQQSEGLAKRTSALGRTGSGLVDRDFAELENEQERLLQGQLGQITSRAAGQAIQDRLGLLGQGQGLAGQQLARERAAFQDPIQAMQAAGGLEGQAAQLGLQAGQINQQRDLARQAHLERQRQYEDRLARQAMQDRANQMRFMSRGFQSNPVNALNQSAGMQMAGGQEFGANAGTLAQQMGNVAEGGASQPGGIAGIAGQAIEQFLGPQGGGISPALLGGMGRDQVPLQGLPHDTPVAVPDVNLPGLS